MRTSLIAACIAAAVASAGCASHYYAIQDTASGKTYYARNISKSGGAISFRDELSGSLVRMQSYEMREINRREFSRAVR